MYNLPEIHIISCTTLFYINCAQRLIAQNVFSYHSFGIIYKYKHILQCGNGLTYVSFDRLASNHGALHLLRLRNLPAILLARLSFIMHWRPAAHAHRQLGQNARRLEKVAKRRSELATHWAIEYEVDGSIQERQYIHQLPE